MARKKSYNQEFLMALALQLNTMTISEKLGALEEIWADLQRHGEALPSPDWHNEVLQSRVQSVESGTAGFRKLSDVKNELSKTVHS